MLPRWCGFILLCAAVAVADDESFLGAMKSILFGSDRVNGTMHSDSVMHPQPPSGGYSFHQYLQPNAAVRQQSTGQSCSQPQAIGTGPYRIPRWYFNPARGRCELFYWSGCCGNGNNFQTFQSCQTVCEVDPCSQNKEQGVGAVQLNRYFFNKETKICEQFTYFGSGGNRNNFADLSECQTQCPETPNPCAVATNGPLTQCSPGVNSCGVGYYCHIGANTQTTVCCPKPSAVDKCQQPLNIGVGNANIQRWYFNPLSQQCQSCVYKGLQGNENNFLSKQECENSCLVNPCRLGTPYRSQGVTVQCSASNPGVCPGGYYCHIGADVPTSVCCQAIGNSPCEEMMNKGEGSAALTRFYYDAGQRKCLAFNYLGAKGNTNNFLTKESCESTCPVWINPCATGQPLLTMEQKPFHCHQRAPCAAGYFCHLGYDDATTVCCSSEGDPCTLIVKEGYGTQSVGRWFYNQQTRQCQPFTYKGMGGNENNFLLREHCEATCPVWVNACPSGDPYLLPNGKPQPCDATNENSCPMTHWCHAGPDQATTMCCPGRSDPCMNAVVEGEGPLQLTRFYFNAATRQCEEFIYRGLKGNSNNFLGIEDCESRCPVQVNPCPITFNSLRHSVKVMACSATQSCPDKHWCHVGETKETTVCCPNG
ncbi:unnamed protein product [Auanema sp. JU1783]|nr:unnamed protein product [Auanema sp. JU1783]